ncbi:hypothetical protein AB0C51_00215 [Streptomyces pathocidini]|uniref:WXG100 family type VII secretion target n=1 Tax=Streptomyces pathocidini TaxID=1650571 RepID=UPI0033E9A5C8
MSEEGTAEKVYEAGLDLVNPGGDPDVLRAAAKGWRDMGNHLESMFRTLNSQVENTVGEHWRGDGAHAFRELRGKIPIAEADRAAAGHQNPPAGDAARKVRPLELPVAWLFLLGRATIWIFLFSLFCMALLLLPIDGSWRTWVAVAGGISMPAAAISQIVHWVREGKAAEQPS